MTSGVLLSKLASDAELASLLTHPRLTFLQKMPANSELSEVEVAKIIRTCDEILEVLSFEGEVLDGYEKDLERIGDEMDKEG